MGNLQSALEHRSEPPQLKKSASRNKLILHENLPILCQKLIDKSKKDDVGDNISKRAFVKYFSTGHDKFGDILYEHYVGLQPCMDVHYVTKDTFLRVSDEAVELRTEANQLKYCVKVFARRKDHLTRQGLECLIETCYILASTVSNSPEIYDLTSPGGKALMDALLLGAMKGHDTVTVDALCLWIKKNCHSLIFGVHHWVSQRLLHVRPVELEQDNIDRDLQTPQLKLMSLDTNVLLNPVLLYLLTCSVPVTFTKPKQTRPSLQRMLSGQLDPHDYIARLITCASPPCWAPLYNSRDHGCSMNRFQNHVFSYRGPTVLLLALEEDHKFCIAVDQEWRESTQHWGGDHCMVIQVTPEFKVMEHGAKMVYINLTTRGSPHGIQIGHNVKTPTIEIEEELSVVLVRKIPYKLLNLEVWGCASEEAREAQIQQKRWENREAERCHQVNLNAVEWKDNPDKYLLELGSSGANYSNYN